MFHDLAGIRLHRCVRNALVPFRLTCRNGIQAGCERGLDGLLTKQGGWIVRFGVGGFAFGAAGVGWVVRRRT